MQSLQKIVRCAPHRANCSLAYARGRTPNAVCCRGACAGTTTRTQITIRRRRRSWLRSAKTPERMRCVSNHRSRTATSAGVLPPASAYGVVRCAVRAQVVQERPVIARFLVRMSPFACVSEWHS